MPLKQESLSEMKMIPGVDMAIAKLIEAKLISPVVTIQSGISEGRFTEQEFRDWFSGSFRTMKVKIQGPFICQYRFAEQCVCKKPNSFLYEQAAKDYSIDLSKSYIIGDTTLDVIPEKT